MAAHYYTVTWDQLHRDSRALAWRLMERPPFRGVVKHRGWRVKAYKLPAPPDGIDELVVAPAEVELP